MDKTFDDFKQLYSKPYKTSPQFSDFELILDLIASHEQLQSKLDKACAALERVMNQPFKGDWDAQAVFISQALAEIRKKDDNG